MGIRPSIYFIVGIDDFQCDRRGVVTDRRYIGDFSALEWEDKIAIEKPDVSFGTNWFETDKLMAQVGIYHRFKEKSVYDCLVHDSEYGLPNILGVKLEEDNELYAGIAWALSATFDFFQEPGYRIIPAVPLNDMHGGESYVLKSVIANKPKRVVKKDVDPRQMQSVGDLWRKVHYGWTINHMSWQAGYMAEQAMWFLKYIGFKKLRWSDLKFMLYWHWS